jgi:hypothetical protein
MQIVRQTWTILAAVCVAAALAVAVPQMGGCAAGTNGMGSVLLAPDLDTFNKRLAVGKIAATTVRQTATALLDAGKLSSADGENVLASTDVARAGLDIAEKLSATDLTSADAKLTAVKTILDSIRAYLLTKGGA